MRWTFEARMPTDDAPGGDLSVTERQLIDALTDGKWVMSLHREFERFDPLTTPVTDFPLAGYARQAREILANRNTQEVGYAVMVAEWAVQTSFPLEFANMKDDGPDTWADKVGHLDETLPRILQRRRALIDITKLKDLSNAKWQEIFAALGMAYVAKAVNNGLSTSGEAAEAIQIALEFHGRSRSARRKDLEWRELLYRYADGKEDMSATKIAEGYVKYYEERILRDRKKMFPERTVASWVRKARKDGRLG